MELNTLLGKTARVSMIVTSQNISVTVGSGGLEVLATPMMAAFMEQAACECLAGCLAPGQTSVGTQIDVSHTAASPLGAVITATATIECVSGRKSEFKVTASDNKSEIGSGKHTRVIVDAERFVKKTQARI
jgi:predicted thioesterase